MQEFIHHKVEKIENLLKEFNHVQKLLNDRSFEFDSSCDTYLKMLQQYFNEGGNNAKESEVLKIQNLISTVKKGFDPIRLEKIETNKRALLWGFAYHGLESLHGILNEIYTQEKNKLEEAKALISNLILTLYQNNILDDQKLKELNSISKIEVFWGQLLQQNGTISGIDKKLKLTIIPEDIYLLFEKMIIKMS